MLRLSSLFLLLGALVLGGCGRELTAGGFREGEVSAAATDESGPSAARFDRAGDGSESQASVAGVNGSVGLAASVSLVAESGAVVPITDGSALADVVIGSSERVVLGLASVPEGDYPSVRITFTEVGAEVQGLLLVGISFTGTVSVDLGTGPLVVDVQVPVTVREGDPSTVIVDLNTESWLSLATPHPTVPPSATVTADAFRNGIAVTVE